MVKHVVMWKFDAEGAAETARGALEGLRGRIPSLLSLETGLDVSGGPSAFHLVLITTHADREALAEYQDDPAHGEVKRLIGGLRAERAAVDFEA